MAGCVVLVAILVCFTTACLGCVPLKATVTLNVGTDPTCWICGSKSDSAAAFHWNFDVAVFNSNNDKIAIWLASNNRSSACLSAKVCSLGGATFPFRASGQSQAASPNIALCVSNLNLLYAALVDVEFTANPAWNDLLSDPLVVGLILGVLMSILVVVAAVCCCCCRRRRKLVCKDKGSDGPLLLEDDLEGYGTLRLRNV